MIYNVLVRLGLERTIMKNVPFSRSINRLPGSSWLYEKGEATREARGAQQ